MVCCGIFCLTIVLLGNSLAGEKFKPNFQRWYEEKEFFDDPRPVLKNYALKEIIPAQDYSQMVYDIVEMRRKWEQAIGFKSPDIVGKIAPEIVPGRYSFLDKDKHPGLQELMLPLHYQRFKPGAPPFACNFVEIEVVPTRQIYPPLPVIEATLKNMGKTKQDGQGYMLDSTYLNGYPFPRPAGPFKAQQVVYNFQERYACGDHGIYALQRGKSWDKSLKEIYECSSEFWGLRLFGRVQPPVGWYDERARKNGEFKIINSKSISPRDQFGNVIWTLTRRGVNDPNQVMVWIAQVRRLRKLSGTDVQDASPGISLILDDIDGFSQKLSPTIYPYQYRIIAEREYLIPHYTSDGTQYLARDNLELKNVRMERRPLYVVEMTQQDPSYVYGRRVLYIDKETFALIMIENYDQKGRLWRTFEQTYSFYPEMGFVNMYSVIMQDHQNPQTSYMEYMNGPATWITREDVSIASLKKTGK